MYLLTGVAHSGGFSLLPDLIVPFLSALFTGGMFVLAIFPLVQRARQSDHARNQRLDRTMDAVLGCDEDKTVGKEAQEGLVRVIPRLQADVDGIRKTVGSPNGSGRTVMGHVEESNRQLGDTNTRLTNLGLGQATLAEQFDVHMIHDDNRFGDTNRELGAVRRSVENLTKTVERNRDA